jgi:hypothetical protein
MTKPGLVEKLTLYSLKLAGRKFLYKQEFDLPNGAKVTGYVYEKEELFLARTTFLKTIIINKKVFEFSKNTQEYILLHELGHKKVPLITDIFFDTLIILATILLVCTILIIPAIIISLIDPKIINPLTAIIALPMTIAPFVILQYLSEGHAEYYAIKQIKPERYLNATKEIKQKFKNKKTWTYELFKLLTYPKPEWMVKIYNLKNKNEFKIR